MPAELLLIGLSLLLRLGHFWRSDELCKRVASPHRLVAYRCCHDADGTGNVFQLLGHAGLSDLAYRSNIRPLAGFAVSVLMLSGTILIRRILKRLSKAERTQRSINRRYQMLFNTSSDQVFVMEINGQLLEVNQSVSERLGYSREALLQKKFAELKSSLSAEGGVQDHLDQIRKKRHAHL